MKRAPAASNKDGVRGRHRIEQCDEAAYPEAQITKHDLACYYAAVADWILPHLQNRPLTLVRCPNGWNKSCFYQKNADAGVDAAIERVSVETSEGPARYMMANSPGALVALVQMGVLEIHPWGSTRRKLGYADRIIFDFDPDDALDWSQIVEAVQVMKTLWGDRASGLPQDDGRQGPTWWCRSGPRSRGMRQGIQQGGRRASRPTFPDRYTTRSPRAAAAEKSSSIICAMPKERRDRRLCRTGPGKRAVATPIDWKELATEVRHDHFNVGKSRASETLKTDPWEVFSNPAGGHRGHAEEGGISGTAKK